MKQIKDMLDDEVIGFSHGGYHRYLVKWQDQQVSHATCITCEKFQGLDSNLLEEHHTHNSSKSSLFPSGRINGDQNHSFQFYFRHKG